MVDRVPKERWTEVHDIVQEAVTKTTTPPKREMQNGRVIVRGGLTNSWEKKEKQKVKEKGKDLANWMQGSKQQEEVRKPS